MAGRSPGGPDRLPYRMISLGRWMHEEVDAMPAEKRTLQPRDAVIVGYVRTPFGRHAGALAKLRPDSMAGQAIAALVERTGIDPAGVDDVIMGCANQAGEDNRNVARMAAL